LGVGGGHNNMEKYNIMFTLTQPSTLLLTSECFIPDYLITSTRFAIHVFPLCAMITSSRTQLHVAFYIPMQIYLFTLW
jgi:hypothetical protein